MTGNEVWQPDMLSQSVVQKDLQEDDLPRSFLECSREEESGGWWWSTGIIHLCCFLLMEVKVASQEEYFRTDMPHVLSSSFSRWNQRRFADTRSTHFSRIRDQEKRNHRRSSNSFYSSQENVQENVQENSQEKPALDHHLVLSKSCPSLFDHPYLCVHFSCCNMGVEHVFDREERKSWKEQKS